MIRKAGHAICGAVWLLAVTFALAPRAPADPPPQSAAAGARLEIAGAVPSPLSLSAADLKALPRTAMQAGNQPPQRFEGVALTEVLQRAGVPLGDELAGEWLASYVVAAGADGYRVAFSLAELDAGFGNTQVLVADTVDGVALAEGQGPLRLIVPGDRRAARWVRNLKSITIVKPAN
jgi:DMSO/TMAO reductase YedYZ molybdopterin-dependent catalytic subunit